MIDAVGQRRVRCYIALRINGQSTFVSRRTSSSLNVAAIDRQSRA